ncbi:hypothetical protein ILUMI_15910, partial [Ignelater luminosus]
DRPDETKEESYNTLNEMIKKTKRHQQLIIAGDMNGRIEKRNNDEVVAKHREDMVNDNGQRLINIRHRDSGPVDSNIDLIENDGIFKAILRSKLRSGDEILKLHLESMSKTATYLNAKTQNEIINACGDIITKKIVNKINEAKFFSILADESTDISCIEQFSLCFRFYNSTTMKIEENFLKFVPVTNLTGQSLANVLITTLEGLNINSNFMVGQGYDDASSMSGAFHGVQAYIRAKYSSAIYVHCASHSLNLAISDACTVPQVRNSMATLSKLCNLFRTPKRKNVFATEIENVNSDSKKQKLKQLCHTRWSERHDSILVFLKMQEVAVGSLEIIQNWNDRDACSGSFVLIKSVFTTEFQITLQVLAKVFSITLPLCKLLQTINIDLSQAILLAKTVRNTLAKMRQNAVQEFKKYLRLRNLHMKNMELKYQCLE